MGSSGQPTPFAADPVRRRSLAAFVIVLTIGVLPVCLPGVFPRVSPFGWGPRVVFSCLLAFLPCLALAVCWRMHASLSRGERLLLAYTLIAVAGLLEYVHYSFVDLGYYFPPKSCPNNLYWQQLLQESVVGLSVVGIPHSYRFLPNGIVAFLEWLTGSFLYAKTIYRLTFSLFLLNGIYVYARRYCGPRRALLAIGCYALVFPVSIACYAGQLTDPMSHLSFVLALLCIQRGRFAEFALVIIAGMLAKESVLLMLPCYVLCSGEPVPRAAVKAGLLGVFCLGLLVAVRFCVAGGGLDYSDVSGVGLTHLLDNLRRTRWVGQVFFTVGVFLPPAAARWRGTPFELKAALAILLPGILISSWFFSWLTEARNYIPAVIVLAVIALRDLPDQTT